MISLNGIFLYLSVMKYLRRHILLILCLGYFVEEIKSQVNVVPNPGFEDTIVCNSSMSTVYQLPAASWYQYNSVDYYYNSPFIYYCMYSGQGGNSQVPQNGAGFQYPKNGRAYVGINGYSSVSGSKYYREWIQAKLIDTLVGGKSYCVSFCYNQANYNFHAIDRLGIYFSTSGVNLGTTSIFTQYTQQITTPLGQFLNDTLSWQQFKTTYIATGSEVYITLGNFFDSVQTNLQLYPNAQSPFGDGYYFFDDISIISTDLSCIAGQDTTCCKFDSVYIGRPAEIGLDNVWKEISTGTQVGVGAGIWLKPDTSATYVVMQDLCGTVTTDTIRVVVDCVEGIADWLNEHLKIYPNPADDILGIECGLPEATVSIVDLLGKKWKSQAFHYKSKLDIHDLPAGIYLAQIKTGQHIASRKLVVQRP